MMGFGFMGFGFVAFIFVLFGLIWLFGSFGEKMGGAHHDKGSLDSPKEILDQRLARGEISYQEYKQLKEALKE